MRLPVRYVNKRAVGFEDTEDLDSQRAYIFIVASLSGAVANLPLIYRLVLSTTSLGGSQGLPYIIASNIRLSKARSIDSVGSDPYSGRRRVSR
jgi:hypothetical protein